MYIDSFSNMDSRTSEDCDASWQPLIPVTATNGMPSEDGLSASTDEEAYIVEKALAILKVPLGELRSRGSLNRGDTAELLRDTCQLLSDLATDLEQSWHQTHHGEPQPSWAIEVIPEEELARIGWDFHSNRVLMKGIKESGSGLSIWQAFGYIIAGDPSAGFAESPSAPQVEQALSRVATRLGGETVPCW